MLKMFTVTSHIACDCAKHTCRPNSAGVNVTIRSRYEQISVWQFHDNNAEIHINI